jgi:hypothetical protein
MRKYYDFSDAVKNPYAERLKDGYTITVEHKDHDEIITVKRTIRRKNVENMNNKVIKNV